MKILVLISRILVGLVFVFSGIVKAIDPLGSTYKFTDYFNAFGMESLAGISFPLAIFLSAIEFLAGASLLFNLKPQIGTWLSFLFMLFFTPLTLILALTNPVTDCGCFGDAIIMTNWQTFGKNIVIIIFAALLFWRRKELTTQTSNKIQWSSIAALSIVIIWFQIYNYQNLPVRDFRPYSVGTYIPNNMTIPEGAPRDSSITYLYYQKDGLTKEFTYENYPWQDTTWKWVETKDILISKGYEPPIHNLSIVPLLTQEEMPQEDILNALLQRDEYIIWIVAYNLKNSNTEGWQKIAQWLKTTASDTPVFVLTASDVEDAKKINQTTGYTFNFYTTDAITLKTIVRSNPGVVLLQKGTIKGKWHYRNLPITLENLR